MRIFYTLVFLFVFSLASSQNNNARLTLSFENTKITEVLNQIESIVDVKFFYIEDWIKDVHVSGSYNNASLDTVLNDIFKDTVINFYILENQSIILTQNNAIYDELVKDDDEINIVFEEKESQPTFNKVEENIEVQEVETIKIGKEEITQAQKKHTISGYVKDVVTGKPLSNVTVLVKGKDISTSTNSNGYYKLEMPSGSYTLVATSLKSEDIQKKIVVYNDGEINFNLEEKFEALDEVIIEVDVDKNVKEVITGLIKIDVEGIKNIPLVLG